MVPSYFNSNFLYQFRWSHVIVSDDIPMDYMFMSEMRVSQMVGWAHLLPAELATLSRVSPEVSICIVEILD